jgi:acyl-CoA-dependent ceramide synthase
MDFLTDIVKFNLFGFQFPPIYQKPADGSPEILMGRVMPPGYYYMHVVESSFPSKEFFFLIFAAAVGFSVLRYLLGKFVINYVAETLHVKEQHRTQFEESWMQVCFYFFAFVYNTKFLLRQDWFYYPILCFLDAFPRQIAEPEIFLFYGVQIGWYLHCVYVQLFVDSKKSDFYAMLAHHAITLSLQYFAFTFGYFRIGMLVMFSMDVCDVFLHGCKLFKFIVSGGKIELSIFIYVSAFSLIPISWFCLRLVYFPIAIMYTTMVTVPYYGGLENCKLYWEFNILLVLLFLLQIWWFSIICYVGFKAKAKGRQGFDDPRDPAQRKMKPNGNPKSKSNGAETKKKQ